MDDAYDEASETLDSILPDELKESNAEADFDLIEISLDQMEAAINAGEREQAEQALGSARTRSSSSAPSGCCAASTPS